MLARLLVARGAAVSAERLIDDLWDGDPPAKAAVSLQAYVSNLRRLLEPARGPRQESRLLVSAGRGYALREVDVDAAEFETLTTAGEPALALALWQGAAYGEFTDRPWAVAEAADHFRHAAEVARRWESPSWEAQARTALGALDG
ncbi:winged helix-turn-helix domain-containing protein [Kitasatospora griseola]|uniref:AfsR/SARP family transcriptional regulator n=1 Tax=Kitasatospora griseola TaxID=2064 RepID=UPI0038556B24